jgi:IS5 family transposase
MLQMYVAQQYFGLPDEGIEDALYDSQAIRGFVGARPSREAAPDATTLLKFRRLLEQHDLMRASSRRSMHRWRKRRGCCCAKGRSWMRH